MSELSVALPIRRIQQSEDVGRNNRLSQPGIWVVLTEEDITEGTRCPEGGLGVGSSRVVDDWVNVHVFLSNSGKFIFVCTAVGEGQVLSRPSTLVLKNW